MKRPVMPTDSCFDVLVELQSYSMDTASRSQVRKSRADG